MKGASIYCRENDGFTRGDRSHLTDDTPVFVNKMQNEGLNLGLDDDF